MQNNPNDNMLNNFLFILLTLEHTTCHKCVTHKICEHVIYSYNTSSKGIIFLAAYPNKKIDDSLKCLSMYGSNDKVLNKKEYNKNISNFPSNYKEVIIEGGNHSNFGDYGFQRRDGKASISKEEQVNITKNEIINFVI